MNQALDRRRTMPHEDEPGRGNHPERRLGDYADPLRQAGASIRRREELTRESQARCKDLLEGISNEIQVANARTEAAEARALAAERRVQELEACIDQIHEAIREEILDRHGVEGCGALPE